MKDIILIGAGNVATHLGLSLKKRDYNIVQVYSRDIDNAEKLAQKINADSTNNLAELKSADLIIISVNDDAISYVLSQIKNTAVAHTSGSIGLNVFKNHFSNCGVIYPLQTFNKEVEINISEVPFCIEGNSLEFENQLTHIAREISSNVVVMDSEKRKRLHIAAVFACNFSNHMFAIADDLLTEMNINFEILLPLIKQTIIKLDKNKPETVQTGPAIRNEKTIIQQHINLIQRKEIKELYQKISINIIKKHA